MKSYKVVEFGQPLQRVEEPTPAPRGEEVLVRITAAGVCHSDVHLWEGFFDMGGGNKYSTAKTMNPPRIMGHEIVGVVEALGPDAKGAKVGDKAVVYPWIGCGKCWYCENGTENLCPTPRALGVNKDGGYADHVLVPHARYLYPYGSLPDELACLYACSGITAFGAVKKAVGHDAGRPILVIGAGGVGLMGVRFAKAVLGREPIVADIDEKKRKLALENGACAAIDPREKE
ncbi:MAG TPA: alcohol dehydrogenase catalytic domain-containing protein, partial [Reyranella sp.]|nr:alcohol dehydrogenase catalytic domain-containing protein [Reyranella sp.]